MSILDLYAGIEELELENVAEEVSDAVEETVKTEIAEVATAIEEQSGQIEELTETVNELEEASEEVVEIVEGLESLLASGNFHAPSFAYQYNRAAKLNVMLGGRNGSRLGAESLGDASTAQLMARDGIEGFMETVKGWGKKAADFIKHIFNTVISFFSNLFDQAGKIQSRATSLKEKVKADAIKDKVKLGGWNAYFDYKANGYTSKFSGLKGPDAEITGLIDSVSSITGESNVQSFRTAYGKLSTWFADNSKVFKAKESDKDDNQKRLIGQEAGIRLLAEYGKTSEIEDAAAAVKIARGTKVFYKVDAEGSKGLKGGEEAAKANDSQLKGICDEAIAFAKELRESKVKAKFSKAERDKTVGMLLAVKASGGKDDADKEAGKVIDGNIKLIKAVYAMSANVSQSAYKFRTSFRKAQLDMVAAHLK